MPQIIYLPRPCLTTLQSLGYPSTRKPGGRASSPAGSARPEVPTLTLLVAPRHKPGYSVWPRVGPSPFGWSTAAAHATDRLRPRLDGPTEPRSPARQFARHRLLAFAEKASGKRGWPACARRAIDQLSVGDVLALAAQGSQRERRTHTRVRRLSVSLLSGRKDARTPKPKLAMPQRG